MPYKITKEGDKYCVASEDTGQPIKGGRHANRSEAVDHLQALYALEAMAAVAESFSTIDDGEPTLVLEEGYEEYAISEDESPWAGPIAFEGQPTGDNRSFAEGSVTWDELPLPLLWQKSSGDGHGGSVVIGRVDEINKKDDTVFGMGVLLNTVEANEYKDLLKSGAAGGVSIDGDSAEYSVEEQEGGKAKVNFSSIRIRGLTAVAIPAFAGAKIALVDASTEFCEGMPHDSIEDFKKKKRKAKKGGAWKATNNEALVAAAAPVRPPGSWFRNQHLPGPTPLTVLDDGQVFGHIALFGTCHIGMPKCTTPPKGGTYAYFHTGAVGTDDGDEVSVGHLTFDTGHASVYSNAGNAAAHYDNTGTVAADVAAGEDEFGIWVAGGLRPHLSDEQVRTFRAAPISGDWRRIGARMELVAALSVNTPGFPVPRTRTKVLVAGGQDTTFISTVDPEDYDAIGRQTYKEDLAAKIEAFYTDEDQFDAELEKFTVEQLESFIDAEGDFTEEFYNMCHDDGGFFCEGPDGPGRVRDNNKKAEKAGVGSKAPQWAKNLISRKITKSHADAQKLLPKDSPQYMKDILKRKVNKAYGQ